MRKCVVMKTQKELKEKYMDIIKKEIWNDEKMQDYARKNCAYIVELTNGNIICLEKPSIKKDFCFGYGCNATYTDEELNRAEELCNKAQNDTAYFIQENMRQLTNEIENLKLCLERKRECYTYINYSGQPANSELVTYSIVSIHNNPEYATDRWERLESVRKLGEDDIKQIIKGLEEVSNLFLKRLNSYLKRYGLKKLNVWAFCVD